MTIGRPEPRPGPSLAVAASFTLVDAIPSM